MAFNLNDLNIKTSNQNDSISNFNKVVVFNNLFGNQIKNIPDVNSLNDEISINSKMNLIKEEMKELLTAVENKNFIETVDALGDLLYVVYGMFTTLGVNADIAFDLIHKSNMTKLCLSYDEAKKTCEYYLENKNKLGYEDPQIRILSNNNINYYIVYNKPTNKILKSINYSPVDLKECCGFGYLRFMSFPYLNLVELDINAYMQNKFLVPSNLTNEKALHLILMFIKNELQIQQISNLFYLSNTKIFENVAKFLDFVIDNKNFKEKPTEIYHSLIDIPDLPNTKTSMKAILVETFKDHEVETKDLENPNLDTFKSEQKTHENKNFRMYTNHNEETMSIQSKNNVFKFSIMNNNKICCINSNKPTETIIICEIINKTLD